MTQEFLNQCKKNLIDLTARNALINFKFNSGYTYHEHRFGAASNSFEVAVKKSQSNETESQERLKKLKKIHAKQEEIKSEKGFNPTAFAFGFFKYKDNDQERFAPIYLVPAIVEKDGRGGFKASLENGFQEAKFNFAIREKFKEFDVNLTSELTDVLETSQEEVSFEILRQKTQEITEFLQNNPVGITVEINIALSVFNSAKASLYHEMVKHGSDMLNHDLLKNFLQSGKTLLQYFGRSECPSETDKNPSQKFYSPFDFDSSQLQAIKAAKDGKNFIIQGPPGTGKSQTISNIIAELVADGKKVLFVAEKKAAIEAVLKNFSKIGLEKIFLDLHDKKSKSKDIRDQVVDSLEFFQNQGGRTPRTEDFFSKLDQSKSQITKRTEALHAKTALGKTAFELIGDLYNLQNFENLNCQFNTEITAENFKKITKILDEIQNHQHIYFDDTNPYLRSDFNKSVDVNPEILEKNFLILADGLTTMSQIKKQIDNLGNINSKILPQLLSLGFKINNLNEGDLLKIFNFLVEIKSYQHIYFDEHNPYLTNFSGSNENKNFEFLVFDLSSALSSIRQKKDLLRDLEKESLSKTLQIKELKIALPLQLSENEAKKIIEILDELKNCQQIYFDEFNPYLKGDFKKSKDINFDFLESKFFELEENLKLTSRQYGELKSGEKEGFLIRSELELFAKLSFFGRLRNFFEVKKIKENFSKKENEIKNLKFQISKNELEGKRIVFEIENYFEIPAEIKGDNQLLAQEINLRKSYLPKLIETLRYKDLKRELENLGCADFWQKILLKKSDFESEKKLLDQFFTNFFKAKQLKIGISEAEVKKEKLISVIENYFEIPVEIKDDSQLLEKEIDLRKSYLPKLNETLRYKDLKRNIESFGCADFWAKVLNKKTDFESEKNLFEEFLKNFSAIQHLISSEIEVDLQKEKTLFEIENYFEIPAEIKSNNQLLAQEINLRKSYLPKLVETLKYKDLKWELESLGCKDFWQKICSNKIEKRKILDVFKKNFYLSALNQIAAKNDFIANTKDFVALVEDFKKDDKGLISLNATRLAQKIKSKNAHLDENYEVLQLKIRQRFGKPRKLISRFKETILDSINCVVCSPLTICEFFEINDDLSPIFDAVIFDEASQIFTWDAISSIFRAKQLIIAGDTKQMPPSNLFSGAGGIDDEDEFDEDGDGQNVNDTSSLLDFASTKMKELLLNWHYRSKFEELILPSNRFIYNDKLVTFPNSAKQEKPIEFIHLEGGIWEKQTNDLETKKTIELLKNLYYSGKKSVGVIAINAKQCKLIRDLVEMDEDLYGWLETKDENGLFIKNLQNCQGDERDTIIICTSYAKDKDGKISGRMFSQLNKDNAEKRLNVMFSRAREKVFLLSSLKSEQISNPSQHKAIEFLKKYLTYAESGATAEGWKISANQNFQTNSDNFDSGFEESVCKALRNIGLKVESQVGCSGYKIDLAIICPKTQNYILGIECDGEIYHSGKTARERDRLRQEVLENKGWKIHRIWCYDWLENRSEQIEKIKNILNKIN